MVANMISGGNCEMLHIRLYRSPHFYSDCIWMWYSVVILTIGNAKCLVLSML